MTTQPLSPPVLIPWDTVPSSWLPQSAQQRDRTPGTRPWCSLLFPPAVVDFTLEIKVIDKTTIYSPHRVNGCTFKLPFYRKHIACLVNPTGMRNLHSENQGP
ncbi:hypothetical protein B0H19DRAFT_1108928 [Mycena capillaripes]|nr:hypothetical protein B0H19DRAFT_1108928 [Mycena capillaripes]